MPISVNEAKTIADNAMSSLAQGLIIFIDEKLKDQDFVSQWGRVREGRMTFSFQTKNLPLNDRDIKLVQKVYEEQGWVTEYTYYDKELRLIGWKV